MKTIATRVSVLILLASFLLITQNTFCQWTKTAGPPGMNVNVFLKKNSTLYAGTTSKGVFKSGDDGLTWTAANGGIENKSVFSLVADGSYVIAGTDDGAYRSNNGGTSWTPANTGIQGMFIYSLLKANGYVFAGTIAFGVFKSNDHGNTWTDANGGALGSSSIYAMCFSSPNLVAFADNLIFYSNDNGNSWFIPNNSPFLFSVNGSFHVKNDSIMISSISTVYRSFDKGVSWEPSVEIDPDISICGLIKSGKFIYAGSPSGIFKSQDFGATWTAITPHGLRFGNRFVNAFYKSGDNFLIGYDEIGVGYSTDKGKHWNYTLSGFTPASSIDNAMLVSGTTLISGTHSDGVYQSTDNGATWAKIGTTNNKDTLSNGIVFSVLKSGNVILAGTCGFGLYRSGNSGSTWTHITSGLPVQAGTGFLCIFGLALSGSNMLAATDEGMYYSTDNGLNWNASNITGSNNLGAGVAANGSVACAAVNVTAGSNIVYRSTNSGVSWSSVFSSSFDDFTCMASDAVNHFYVGSFSNNYVSADNGLTWNGFGSGIPAGTGAYAIGVKNNNVWVGNGDGIYFSNNSATSFTLSNTGLDPAPNNSVQGFAISADNIFAGLFNDGIWKRPLSDYGIGTREGNDLSELPATISPNPLNQEAILSYKVDAPSDVAILIYDATGKLIREVKNANVEAGIYQEKINGNDLPAGIYFASVRIGEKITSVKFTVVK